ncbi:E3 ubiquitin-protein ligase MARCHF5 [Procambarus clarkii]|uniref:E3 ubiquitin-protein ligase MARCHF5 n=1 Tax=Procambarus clarkii TaxID=6728 RepID=UPI001E674E75|nr:E3 ubiquitin-protein ligase MARCHF5-like isoform X2 [Procambarus clarkii]
MADEPQQTDVSSSHDEENKRYCWVCYASDEDDETAPWVKPCKCRGTTKWVHQSCLQRWVDEKQKGNSTVKVNCPQCGVEYFIAFPNMGQLMLFLDRVDAFIYKVCPFVAAGVVVGSIYWTAVTYGAITVMQVVGYQEGMALMEQADPLVLLVGLPTIPIFLILGKMVRWEDKVLRLIRASVQRLPFLKYLLPAFRYEEPAGVSTTAVISDPVNATRVLCGALSLPTLATIVGRLFFPSAHDNLTRTLLGGASFLVVKGLFKVYYKQQQHVMQSRRKIIDYPQDSSTSQVPAASTPRAPPPTPQELPDNPSMPNTQSLSNQEFDQQFLQQQQ